MNDIVYDKLVRDRIPEIIESSGRKCDIRVMEEQEYLEKLEAKLDEELSEFHKGHDLEELADLMEVIYSLTVALGNTVDDLERIRLEKAQSRGSFDKRILLNRVYENIT